MRLTFNLCKKMAKASKTFLFWFSNEHSNFRIPELESLFKVFKLDPKVLSKRRIEGPFIFMDFPDEEGPRKLMSRSVLAHSCYEVFARGHTLDEMHKNFKTNLDACKPYENESFQIRIETYGKTVKHTEKLKFIDTFEYLPMEGKVDLKNPECSLHLILYYGLDANKTPPEPFQLIFGRWLTDSGRRLAFKINLKDRKFIGNTSMDPLLSLVMANLGTVKEHDIVLDPFVGTGSLLVAAAVMGANVVGSDIDYLMLHGRTRSSRAFQTCRAEDESIRANLIQYGMEDKYLDILVADASRPIWRDDFRFDVILTDPPYGIREPTERLGSGRAKEENYKIKEEHLDEHIPCKIDYSLTDMFCDLMDFGTQKLIIGGRLVYWIPISREDYDVEKLPKNPCLELVSNNEQVLTTYASRRLLVFEKKKEPTALCRTEIDEIALMYRIKFFENVANNKPKTRKWRQLDAFSRFGKATKRGQQMVDVLP